MNKKFPVVTAFLVLFHLAFSSSYAEDYNNKNALTGLAAVKVYFDVNVGAANKLLMRLELVDTTYNQLVSASVKPEFIIGFRGAASNYVTKGDDWYIDEEDVANKKKIQEWIDKFNKRGIFMEQCLIAAKFQDINPDDFVNAVQIVQNGYISMAAYQAKGYSIIPMD